MAVTSIEWTATQNKDGSWSPGYTFNPWIGCTKVSGACDNCYAETLMDHRYHRVEWGGERNLTSPANWRQPLAWNRAAKAAGERRRVFCASLSDVFDNQVPEEWRFRLWDLIAECQHLDWLLLTKRPQNIVKMLPSSRQEVLLGPGSWPWPHVWLGTTAENQKEWDRRIAQLAAVPAAIHFVSVEPMLGPIDVGNAFDSCGSDPRAKECRPVDWVICGGESGPRARPMDPAWARLLRDQCQEAGVAFFFKQWGQHFPAELIRTGPDGEVWRTQHDGQERWSIEELSVALAEGAVPVQYDNVGKKASGRLLDGRDWSEFPT